MEKVKKWIPVKRDAGLHTVARCFGLSGASGREYKEEEVVVVLVVVIDSLQAKMEDNRPRWRLCLVDW